MIAWAACALGACGGEGELIDGIFTPAEWDKLAALTPLRPPPPSPTNRFADSDAAAALGQRLWFERRYAGPIGEVGAPGSGALGALGETGKVGCVDCHDERGWFSDTRSVPNTTSLGTFRSRRNSPSIVNVAYYEWGGWGGAQDQLWKQAAAAPEGRDLNSTRLRVAHVIYDHYRADYDALFDPDLDPALDPAHPDAARFPPSGKPKAAPGDPDGPWERMAPADQRAVNEILASFGKAIEAYERRLVSGDAPFDRYVAGDPRAISESAKRGLRLFIGKAACDACHNDQTLTDNRFHNTGIPQSAVPLDEGRLADLARLASPWSGAGEYSDDRQAGQAKLDQAVASEELRGQFRTKSLRHVAETGPYFHDGSAPTLEAVVRFYNAGGGTAGFPGVKSPLLVPLGLSEPEIADLVAFLGTLTGAPVPAALTANTAAP